MRWSVVGVDGGVGDDVGEQRGHVGLDHADALGDADDGGASPTAGGRAVLGTVSVVIIARDPVEAVASRTAPPARRCVADPIHRERPPDDAGRRHEHLLARTARGPPPRRRRGSAVGAALRRWPRWRSWRRPRRPGRRRPRRDGGAARRWARERLWVNTPAAVHGASAATTTKSSVASLMPTWRRGRGSRGAARMTSQPSVDDRPGRGPGDPRPDPAGRGASDPVLPWARGRSVWEGARRPACSPAGVALRPRPSGPTRRGRRRRRRPLHGGGRGRHRRYRPPHRPGGGAGTCATATSASPRSRGSAAAVFAITLARSGVGGSWVGATSATWPRSASR